MPLKNKMITKILVALVFFVWEHRILSLSMCTNGCRFHCTANQKQFFPDLGYDMSSVRNFCCCSSDVISQGNQWWGPDNREKNEFSLVLRASVGKSHTRERWSLSHTHTHSRG